MIQRSYSTGAAPADNFEGVHGVFSSAMLAPSGFTGTGTFDDNSVAGLIDNNGHVRPIKASDLRSFNLAGAHPTEQLPFPF